MNEQPTEQTAKQGSEIGQERPAHLTPFATLDEAKQVTPPSAAFKVSTVYDPEGKKVWAWDQSGDNSIAVSAKKVG
jgi:hypothetical protein